MSISNDTQALLKKSTEVATYMASLSNPIRLRILCSILMQAEQRANVSMLMEATQLAQAPLSQLLARMKDDSLLDCQREGRKVYYFIPNPQVIELLKACKEIFCRDLDKNQ
jgi:DNA-binding transcriptional ArsR family regulator